MKNRKGLGTSRVMAAMVIFTLATMSLAYAGDTASDTVGATLTMGNAAPTIDAVNVQNGGTYNPTSGTTTAIAVRMTVSDANGWDDINLSNSNTKCVVAKGATSVSMGSCTKISNSSATTAVFECTGNMEYFYETGAWSVNCSAYDAGGLSDNDATQSLTYNRLESIDVTPTTMGWTGISMSSTDVASDDNPLNTANLGNANFAGQNLTASDLVGETTPSESVAATDFSANDADAAGGEGLSTSAVTISGITLSRGEAESVNTYLYLEQISTPVSAQTYSSGSPWEVMMFGASN